MSLRLRSRLLIVGAGLALAAWLAYEVLWSVLAPLPPRVNHLATLNELVERYQPAGENGWAAFREAVRLVADVSRESAEAGGVHDSGSLPDFSRITTGPIAAGDIGRELDAIERMDSRGVFDLMERAAAAPVLARRFEGDEAIVSLVLPELAQARSAARMRAATLRLAVDRGDHEAAVSAFEQLLMLARATGSQGTVIDRMVGSAIATLALTELSTSIVERPPGDATCRALLTVLDEQLRLPPMEMALEAVRVDGLSLTQATFAHPEHGAFRKRPLSRRRLLRQWSRLDETTNAYVDGLLLNAKQRRAERFAGPAFDTAAFITSAPGPLAQWQEPTGRILAHHDVVEARIAALRVALALAEHRNREGVYPADLDALAGGLLEAVPADPIHGGSFGYRRMPAGAEVPYIIYSTGIDRVDDTAAVGKLDLDAARTLQGGLDDPGSDFLFDNRRRSGPP